MWQVTGLVEKPAVERGAEQPGDLRPLPAHAGGHGDPADDAARAGGEIQLTDALVELLEREEIYAVVIEPDEGYDTGNVLAWLEANVALALEREEYGDTLRESLKRLLG